MMLAPEMDPTENTRAAIRKPMDRERRRMRGMGKSNSAVTVVKVAGVVAEARVTDTSLNFESEVNTTMDTTANTKIKVARNSAATAWINRAIKKKSRVLSSIETLI